MKPEQRPREWDIRLAAGPVPIGLVMPLVRAAIEARIDEAREKTGRGALSAKTPPRPARTPRR